MKIRLVLLVAGLIISLSSLAQSWTPAQLNAANTAQHIASLSKMEKEVILYINLCRLFPKDFLRIELRKYEIDSNYEASYLKAFAAYKKSLEADLLKRVAADVLKFDEALYKDARCYSTEISHAERKPHERKDCPPGQYAECISFGLANAKDIAMQLLIDAEVPSLGHRMICLDESYHKVGISAGPHFSWQFCAVLEFI
ncbi:hypothetical protein [Chitinophaga nivalis]|uniref:SCP domain-containing protein n=1 Tax=Chitinophaga nivalis TaxID=2991709 RepID=A0ABT3IH79_9BACT|nr:hypothetical protein [Chitinophaga nivalis]MCW3467008.1 hypothetical protein [Chitinophaga nivalis]MCW3483301.1 hypothetical protein [Chitinophaga nivalis]